jgi:hypothetical protein
MPRRDHRRDIGSPEPEPERLVEPETGTLEVAFELPMPSISLLELTPATG